MLYINNTDSDIICDTNVKLLPYILQIRYMPILSGIRSIMVKNVIKIW